MQGFLDDVLTSTERDYLERARGFGREVLAGKADAMEAGESVVPMMRKAVEYDLLRLETPTSHGGLGLRYLVKLAVLEALSHVDMAFAFAMTNTQNVAPRLLASGQEEHVEAIMRGEIFAASALSEPGAGSDFAGIRTRATKTDGGWLLNGEKGWITNATIADLFVTYAQTDPEAGWRGIGCFLVDARAPGFTRAAAYDIFGGTAIGAGGFKLDNYFVADANVIAGPVDAFKLAMQGVNGARTYVAGMCAGMLADALAKAIRYGETRETFGKKLTSHQGLAWSLADISTDLEALRALTRRAGLLIDQNGDVVMAAAQAKKFSGRVTLAGIGAAIQAMGAAGLRREYGLGRHLAAAKIAAYTDGSTEIMQDRIAAGMVNAYG